MPGTVSIYNPLPTALGHFEDELASVLAATGRTVHRMPAPSAEIRGASARAKVHAVRRDLVGRVRASHTPHDLVVCWPVFGLADPALWWTASARTRITLLVHDPRPLRRQVGMGRFARRLGRAGVRHPRVTVGVLSSPAKDDVIAMGWPEPAVLPHPIMPRTPPEPRTTSEIVLVCGQYKPTRDLELLKHIGGTLRDRGLRPVIRGRGWPEVRGWDVQEGFLSEPALDASLAESAAVLIPYSHFYQSGVAVRAVELGVPVAGPQHPFLIDLLGPDWPGLVGTGGPDEWVDAVATACERAPEVHGRGVLLRSQCERAWDAHLS